MSTALIAEAHPDALVVGIDQSAHRLAKHQATGAQNYLLLHAEAEPLWLCLVEAGVTLHSHWLLYPNPWPKASQLKKRVHGHGAFPVLSRLGGGLSSTPIGTFLRRSSPTRPPSSASRATWNPSPPTHP
jgi:hypothetical protein